MIFFHSGQCANTGSKSDGVAIRTRGYLSTVSLSSVWVLDQLMCQYSNMPTSGLQFFGCNLLLTKLSSYYHSKDGSNTPCKYIVYLTYHTARSQNFYTILPLFIVLTELDTSTFASLSEPRTRTNKLSRAATPFSSGPRPRSRNFSNAAGIRM